LDQLVFEGTNTIKIFFPKKITIRFFSGTLTAVRYLEIIQQFLGQHHDDVFVNGYFQQDGAPTHTTYETLNIIQEMHRQYHATSLCATSFYYFIYLKKSIFQHPLNNLEELPEANVGECQYRNCFQEFPNALKLMEHILIIYSKRYFPIKVNFFVRYNTQLLPLESFLFRSSLAFNKILSTSLWFHRAASCKVLDKSTSFGINNFTASF
jgi:hypothetical protein